MDPELKPTPPHTVKRIALLAALAYVVAAALCVWAGRAWVSAVALDADTEDVELFTVAVLAFTAITAVGIFVATWRVGIRQWNRAQTDLLYQQKAFQERWYALFDHGPDAGMVLEDGRIVAANREAGRLLGYSSEELVGRSPADISPPEQPDGSVSAISAAQRLDQVRPGGAARFPWRHRRRDGRDVDVEVSLARVRDGDVERVLAWLRDVTAERESARELAQANAQLRLLVEGTPNFFFFIQNLDGSVSYVSPSVEKITGRPAAAWLGLHHWYVTDNPVNVEARRRTERHVRGTFDDQPSITEIFHADGHRVTLEINEYPRYSDGRQVGLFGIAHDITARIEAERAVADSELKYRTLFESASDAILIFDAASETILEFNPRACEVYGYTREELLGKSVEDLTVRAAAGGQHIREVLAKGTGQNVPTAHRRRDGSVVHFLASSTVIDYAGRRAILSFNRDVTEMRRMEAALRESQRALETLVANLPGMAYRCRNEPDWPMEFVSQQSELLTGYTSDELCRKRSVSYGSLIHPDDRERVWTEVQQAIAEDRPFELEYRLRRASGEERWVWERGRGIEVRNGGGMILEGFVTDITERRKAEAALKTSEERLRQAQKMEAVGRLAGGVAHDFNNLLQGVMSTVEALHGRGDAPEYAATLGEIADHIRRGAALARQLLVFSRRDVLKPERLDLNAVVDETLAFLRRLVRENIRIVKELSPRPLVIEGDRGQLDQVLMNLVVNASDAMPRGGTLTIRSGHSGDEWAWFEVTDDGVGMSDAVKARIFEPFFSTKVEAKGTGLGLAVVHGIVEGHGGRIEVASRQDAGSSFRILLPRADTGPIPTVRETAALDDLPQGAGQRVLLVEDEPAALHGLRDLLHMLGYDVDAVESGEAAETLPAVPPYDVLLTDFLLPGITGSDLARKLRERWPELTVILMSGYAEDETVRRSVLEGRVRFLQKPFDMGTLARELRAALEE